MSAFNHAGHLRRRFVGSLSRRAPSVVDSAWALGHLLAGEAVLWQQMLAQDRRHSIAVARRFAGLVAQPTRAEMAGALLHDVGKTQSGLGTLGRVAATVIGQRTSRFRRYHEHEALGIEMLRAAQSDSDTLAVIEGSGRAAQALRAADSI